jgi:hypothetical protein
MKTCKGICGRTLPATPEYFYKHPQCKDGLMGKCKKCRDIPNVVPVAPDGHKICKGPCGRTLPATLEFWYHKDRGKYGLNSHCKECIAEEWKWSDRHPDTKKRMIAKQKEYQARPEARNKKRAHDKLYHARPEIKKHKQEYSKEYRSLPETKEHGKEYRRRPEIKEYNRIQRHKRRALQGSIGGTHTPEQIQDQLKRQKHKCYYCRKRFEKKDSRYIYHIEHTFPLSRVAGTDIPANSMGYLVLACPSCNSSKGNKFPWEWPEGGRLC